MIRLEPTTNQHLPWMLAMLREPGVAANLFWDEGRLSLETLPATLLKVAPETASRAFSIIQQEALVGVVTINDIHPVHRSATIGILAVDPMALKRGWCGLEAGRKVVKYAYSTLNLNRLDCRIMAHNKQIQTLVRRVGFTMEGVVRDAIYKDGRYVNINLFSMLKDEWEGKNGTGST